MICDCRYAKIKKVLVNINTCAYCYLPVLLLTCVVTYPCCYLSVGVVACVILAA